MLQHRLCAKHCHFTIKNQGRLQHATTFTKCGRKLHHCIVNVPTILALQACMSGTSAELLSNHVCQHTENIARDATTSQVEVTYNILSF